MKNREKIPSESKSSAATDIANKNSPKKPAQEALHAADDSGQKIDRSGFDLGDLLATRRLVQVWALVRILLTQRAIDGFSGDGLITI